MGGAVLAWHGYDGLLLVTALAFALVALPVLWLGATPPGPSAEGRPGAVQHAGAAPSVRLPLPLPAVLSFTLFHAAMFSGSVALPLYVTEVLGRSATDVGLLFSVCALAEIPAALGLMLLPERVSKERAIGLGLLLFVVYFGLVAVASSLPLLLLTQVARGVAIAVVQALGITYFQDLLPDGAGRATTLFSNTATAGSLVAGIAAGATAQALGYREALLGCGLLSAVAWVLLMRAQPVTLRRPGARARRGSG